MKEKITGANFVRAISALGIVTYHFSCAINDTGISNFKPFYGNWGDIFVTVFFILSGFLLYYNNSIIKSYKTFFAKRWLSIFPMFYIAFFSLFSLRAISARSFFYLGHPQSFILSLLGLDGYFSYRVQTYYILGEWFLGAIIILYILFPLLIKLSKHPFISSLTLLVLYIFQINASFFKVDSFKNIISCCLSFWVGILLMEYYDRIKQYIYSIAFILIDLSLLLLCIYFQTPTYNNVSSHIIGLLTFMFLLAIGEYINKISICNTIINEISKLSYAIFLVHHYIIYKIIYHMPKMNILYSVLLLILVYLVVIAAAYILFYINKKIISAIRSRLH